MLKLLLEILFLVALVVGVGMLSVAAAFIVAGVLGFLVIEVRG